MTKTFCDGCGVELTAPTVYRAALRDNVFDLCHACAKPLSDILARRFARAVDNANDMLRKE